MEKTFKRLLIILWEIIVLVTLFLMLSFQRVWNVTKSKNFSMENAGYLIIGIFFIAIICRAKIFREGYKYKQWINKYSPVLLPVSMIVFFVTQTLFCYGAYFTDSWDPSMILQTAMQELHGEYDLMSDHYFSWYPNNLFLVWIYKNILWLAELIGMMHPEMLIIIINCLIDTIVMYLGFSIAKDYFDDVIMAWITYLVLVIFIGFSPWFIVTYSDQICILIPILILRLYQKVLITKKLKYSCFIGVLSIFGFYIKPQSMIILIAIIISTSINSISSIYKERFQKTSLMHVLLCLMGIFIGFVVYRNMIVSSLHVTSNQEQRVGWEHYLYMGLNDEVDGTYSADDLDYSMSFSTTDERNEAEFNSAIERIEEYGFKGVLRHLCRKQLVNYGDGTFGWNEEGDFIYEVPAWANNISSDFVKSMVYPDGAHYELFLSVKQLLWVMIVAFLPFAAVNTTRTKCTQNERMLYTMILAIIGLTIFELLFEARARYLFIYSPIYVVLAVIGGYKLNQLFYDKSNRKENEDKLFK